MTIMGKLPFSSESRLLHLFYESTELNVHLIVFHRVKNFLWIGKIPEQSLISLSSFNLHYGLYEEIYDLFEIDTTSGINYPTDVYHFLSQISTSRYLHCPPERTDWIKNNNISWNEYKIQASDLAINSAKALMKELDFQFWVACGTLLGIN